MTREDDSYRESLAPGPERILIVDDELAVRMALARVLEERGWEVTALSDADEALAHVREGLCAVVLMDSRLPPGDEVPGHDGMWLLRQIAELDPDLMVIMLSAKAESGSAGHRPARSDWLAQGAFHHLTKPIEGGELIQIVQHALENRRLLLENKAYRQDLARLTSERTAQLSETMRDLQATKEALETAYRESLYRLATAAEYRDEETGNHIRRMGLYSRIIAEEMKCDNDFINRIHLASPMHDIGKIGIRDSVLLKPGTLTQGEFEEIKQHSLIGARILAGSDSPLFRLAEQIALTHHERYDGSGYPFALRGEEIPLAGQIVAVADAFDALTSNRIYRPAFPLDDTLRILQLEAARFHPEVLAGFQAGLRRIIAVKAEYKDTQPSPLVRAERGANG